MTRLLPRLCSILLLATLASCGKSGSGERKADAPLVPNDGGGNVLRFGNGDEPVDLDAHVVTGVIEHNILMALSEGLTIEDPKTGAPIPGAAESWDVKDGRVYTFHLRRNAKWSDGTQVTAEDWRFSYERMLSPKLGSEYAYMLHLIEGAKAFNEGRETDFGKVGVKALDEHTLEITLNCPTAYFLSVLTHFAWWPVPKAVVLKNGAIDQRNTGWTKAGSFVGNGPFLLTEWKVNEKIVTARNPHYWNAGVVKLDGVEFYPIKDQNAEERIFRSGQLHRTNSTPLAKRAEYAKNQPHLLRKDPYLSTYYYLINTTKKPFDDPRVRRAISLAIDRELICQKLQGGERPARSLVVPGTNGFTSSARIEGTVEDARRLLAEAGFPGGKGLPSFELLYNTSDNHRQIAEIVQQMLKLNLGVTCTLANQEWKVYMKNRQELNYDVCRAGWTGDYDDPMSFIDLMVSSSGNNHTGWKNADYDRLVADASCQADPAVRNAIFNRAEAMIADHQPIIPLYFMNSVYLLHPRVKGWEPNLLDHHPYQHVRLE